MCNKVYFSAICKQGQNKSHAKSVLRTDSSDKGEKLQEFGGILEHNFNL